jgi:lysyl-tRNA synthetase, class II
LTTWQPNNVEQDRLKKAAQLREQGVTLYPARVQRTHSTLQAIHAYEDATQNLAADADEPQIAVTVTGRIRRANIKGKVSFMHIEDESGRVQLFLRINDMGAGQYDLVKSKLVDVDDFVQASGQMMRTKAGEVSVRVTDLKLLSKSLSPLPVVKQQTLDDGTVVEYGEFSDRETRYRQRYADLAVNRHVRAVFRTRSRVLRAMREYLDEHEHMLEVETPVLQPVYGGAAARPFTTHHNQLKQDLYLRISFELYLKRLLVGGYDAVYEIGRDFRNEGVSWKHNPEFTMLEFYKAYADYNDVMDITEQMVAYIAEKASGSTTFTFDGHEIDVAPPWPRLTIREAVQKYLDVDYMQYPDAEALAALLKDPFGLDVKPGEPWGRLVVEHLFGTLVEPKLIQPMFIKDYPRDVSPFAKAVEDANDALHVERFEFFIAGMEMGNAFTELNDPVDQQERFEQMAALYRDQDDDATPFDADYLRAMRYGMPPSGGFGMGVDRLVMLLTDQHTIRDVLLYPHLRRVGGGDEGESAEATQEGQTTQP